MKLGIKRVYDPPGDDDGTRVLVDRLWPRGLTKEAAAVDLWLKDVAPSSGLRKWFGHDPEKWPEFQRRYRAELEMHGDYLDLLRQASGKGRVTLVFGAKDEKHNQAVVLKEFLEKNGR